MMDVFPRRQATGLISAWEVRRRRHTYSSSVSRQRASATALRELRKRCCSNARAQSKSRSYAEKRQCMNGLRPAMNHAQKRWKNHVAEVSQEEP